MKVIALAAALSWTPVLPAYCEPSPLAEGVIALADAPFCGFFVVATEQIFSLLDWRGGSIVFSEGDRLIGPLNAPGEHVFTLEMIPKLLPDPLTVTAKVEGWTVSLREARRAFDRRCHTKPDSDADRAVVRG